MDCVAASVFQHQYNSDFGQFCVSASALNTILQIWTLMHFYSMVKYESDVKYHAKQIKRVVMRKDVVYLGMIR